ncbi:MAG: metal ABC transporter permease [Verrucomicrobiales bacterium]|nr:metal ABC transporter permease [Verrucomicrobiales bacterium]
MTDFFADFIDAVKTVPLIRYALLAGIVSSLTFGVVGSLVVVRQIGYVASAIAHSILGGIGASVYYSRVYDLPWLTPMLGAIAAALLSVAVIGWATLKFKEREDTIIGAIWAAGMAAGLLFLHYAPGKAVNLESFIFGNILLTSKSDVIATLILGVIVMSLVALFYHKLVAVSFDEEFAALRGVSSKAYYFLLLTLTALSVVLMVRVAGLILSQALLILPAATASRFSRSLWAIMAGAVVITALSNTAGLALSYQYDIPTGPFIVFLAVVFYALSFLLRRKRA